MRRLMRAAGKPLFLVLLALVLTGVASVGLGQRPDAQEPGSSSAATSAEALPLAAAAGSLDATISTLQLRVKSAPRDARGWATLALAHVEQARVTADSSNYPKAEQALQRASSLDPQDDLVLAAEAALAAARHSFTVALRKADAALAENPFNSRALLIRTDALTELGRYDEALAAAQKADQTKPGGSTFARLSYAYELRGDVPRARALMQRAADAAANPADAAFAYYYLGELERGQGRYMAAANNYDRALRQDPQDANSLAGKARLLAAQGDRARAITAYEDIVKRQPLPDYVTELGELYEVSGRQAEAKAQYAVARAAYAREQVNGVNMDLEMAYWEADHGDPAAAVAAAKAEWKRRQSVDVADALGWALHVRGDDRQAIRYARLATRPGAADPHFLYHRGMIELALGENAAAQRSLRSALEKDPAFSTLHAPRAKKALDRLSSLKR